MLGVAQPTHKRQGRAAVPRTAGSPNGIAVKVPAGLRTSIAHILDNDQGRPPVSYAARNGVGVSAALPDCQALGLTPETPDIGSDGWAGTDGKAAKLR